MGQYYRTILTDANNKSTVYNRDVDGEYTLAKLMEHSWWYNPFVSTICSKVFENPMRVVWVGDYADDADSVNELSETDIKKLHKTAWKGKGVGVQKNELYLDELYLVNHSKQIYINCNEYKDKCNNDGWIIHPLPLLTALGNGLGGGDYRGDGSDVGSWANDIISIEKNIPFGYTEEEYLFVE